MHTSPVAPAAVTDNSIPTLPPSLSPDPVMIAPAVAQEVTPAEREPLGAIGGVYVAALLNLGLIVLGLLIWEIWLLVTG